MRLTLRTLLAYLDDTLDPAEIKQIGQKVAESDAARELIARIKQVTRRRRLTAPPATGPGARFDANTVAEYLDSVLDPEQVAEVEKTCLESDVHLAEIAACHQILTLVLGEPALVPPPAKRRMYTLVHGREAIARKPRPRTPAAAGVQADGNEADETLLLGLPPVGKGGGKWGSWLVPVAAVLLVAALGVSLWMALSRRLGPNVVLGPTPPNRERAAPAPDPSRDQTPAEPEALAAKPRPDPDGSASGAPVTPIDTSRANVPRASTERRAVGKHIQMKGMPSILLQRQRDKNDWQRLRLDRDPVHTDDLLVSLPGFRSEIQLDNKVHLLLWGNVEEQVQHMPLLESAVVLHAVPSGQPDAPDVDFTLDRGRVLVTNHRSEPARVRVRFHEEVWDLTLEDPGTEVGIDLWGSAGGFKTGDMTPASLWLVVLRGNARVRIDHRHHNLKAPPGPADFRWNRHGRGAEGPGTLPEVPPWWSKVLPATWQWQDRPLADQQRMRNASEDMRLALDELSNRLGDKAALNVVLAENLKSSRPSTRKLAVRSLGAIDALSELLDALANEEYADVRDTAVDTLSHWLGRRDGQDELMHLALEAKRYTSSQAETILELLHTIMPDSLAKKETYGTLIDYLMDDKPAIRQLASRLLFRYVPEGRKIPYNPAAREKERKVAYEQWKKLLTEGKLPPRLAPPPVPK